jgi:anti-sigma factor (TIGR02949 family)
MDCDVLSRYLDLYLDGELAIEERSEVEAHVRTCDACRTVVTSEARFRAVLRQHLLSVRAPGSLREQVRERLEVRRRPVLTAWMPPLAYAAAVAGVAVLGYVVIATYPKAPDPVAGAVAAHVAASGPEVSGDRDQVDSFLRTHAPFSYRLPLQDGEGIRLVGARVTRLNGIPAVVYQYDRGGRRFSVAQYQPPEGVDEVPPRMDHQDGYTVATYPDRGLVQTLVGDLPDGEISRIVPAAWSR